MSTFRLEDVLEAWLDNFKTKIHTSEPGVVTGFDKSGYTATIQPLIPQAYFDEEGNKQYATKPVCQNVRVLYPGGRMLFNLVNGEPGMLFFCSGSLDNWSPTTTKANPPTSDRSHHLSDAIFVPGFITSVRTQDKPADGELVLAWEKVKIGSALLPTDRSQVIRKQDLENALLPIDIALNAAISGGAPAIAAARLKYEQQRELLGGPIPGTYPGAPISPLGLVTGGILSFVSAKTEAT